MRSQQRWRRIVSAISFLVIAIVLTSINPDFYISTPKIDDTNNKTNQSTVNSDMSALSALDKLEVKGRAPKTNYSREQFGNDWDSVSGCDTRNIILYRDLESVQVDEECRVVRGVLNDPYTSKPIEFNRGSSTSQLVQIDHVVALSDAWQKGAQLLDYQRRVEFANDPLELLAVDGKANQEKSDGDAATWLPPNKDFRCQYVARQIAIKLKYALWVTAAERIAMKKVLARCPNQNLPVAKPFTEEL